MKRGYIIVMILLITGVIMTACSAGGAKNGDIVRVHYTGTLSDGTVFDSSAGKEPLEFTMGKEQMIPGFEKAVFGMKVGEKKTVTIRSDEAYGPRQEDMVFEVGRDRLAPDVDPKVGDQLVMQSMDGNVFPVTILEVTETTVKLDANHRLAGKDLTFEIELVKIL